MFKDMTDATLRKELVRERERVLVEVHYESSVSIPAPHIYSYVSPRIRTATQIQCGKDNHVLEGARLHNKFSRDWFTLDAFEWRDEVECVREDPLCNTHSVIIRTCEESPAGSRK